MRQPRQPWRWAGLLLVWAAVLAVGLPSAPSPRRALVESLLWLAIFAGLMTRPWLAPLVAGATRPARVAVAGLMALYGVAQISNANARYFPASAWNMYAEPRPPGLRWNRLLAEGCDGRRRPFRLSQVQPAVGGFLNVQVTSQAVRLTREGPDSATAAAGQNLAGLLTTAGALLRARGEAVCAVVAEIGEAEVNTPWAEVVTSTREVMRVGLPE